MTLRAKFQVTQVTRHLYATGDGCTVILEPRYDPLQPDEQRFAQSTPSGELRLYVNRPSAVQEFELGRMFSLEFIPDDTDADR